MRTQFAIIMLCLASIVQAQTPARNAKERTVRLSGSVYDSFTKAPLRAVVRLLRTDSTEVKTDTCHVYDTRCWYGFSVPRQNARYILHARMEGYDDAYADFEVKHLARNTAFDLPRILMKKRADVFREVDLDGVVVTGTKVKIQYRGDTIVYNASAFNLPEGSMLDGLIRQLPGAELKDNGDIYVNGQRVDYLLLNGKDFFRGRNEVMLDNLPYYTVKDLKVYHKSTKRSERIGHDVERKDFVMDVNLKREYNRGWMGNAEAGGGTSDRFLARLFGLFFDDHTRLSLYGNANNVNETRRPGSKGEWKPSDAPTSRHTTRQTGFYLNREHPDKVYEETLTTDLQWNDADSRSRSLSERFATGQSILTGSESHSRQKDFSLNLNNSFDLNKPLMLETKAEVSYTRGRTRSESSDSTRQFSLLNMLEQTGLVRNNDLQLSGSVLWIKEFAWGDMLTWSVSTQYNSQKPAETYSSQSLRYPVEGRQENRHSLLDNNKHSFQLSTNLDYMFNFANAWRVVPGIGYRQTYQHEDYLFYLDSIAGILPLDDYNSEHHNNFTRHYHAQMRFYRSNNNQYIDINLPLERADERIHYFSGSETVAHRHDWLFQPRLMFFKFGKNFVSANYQLTTERPEFVTLLPADDTVNPLITIVNNPRLRNQHTHSASYSTTIMSDSTLRSINLFLSATLTQNAWGTRIAYDPATAHYTYMKDNVQGNWAVSTGMGYNRPLGRKRLFTIESEARLSFRRSVDFDVVAGSEYSRSEERGARSENTEQALTSAQTSSQNLSSLLAPRSPLPEKNILSSQTSKVNNLTIQEQLGLTYQRGTLTVGLNGSIAWRHSTSRREDFETISAFDFDYGVTLQHTLPWKIQLATDLKMFSRRGYQSALLNTNDLVWNAQLSRSFLKQRLTMRLQCFDLLHQLSSVHYEVNAQGRTETWHNSLPRYAMLTLAYQLNLKN